MNKVWPHFGKKKDRAISKQEKVIFLGLDLPYTLKYHFGWYSWMCQGDRVVRVKRIMLSLFERSPRGGTEAFYGMSKFSRVQKLLHFEVRSFGRISYKKIRKIWNLEYFTQNVSGVAIFVQFCSNLHQSLLTYVLTIWTSEFLIFWKMADLWQFLSQKMSKNAVFGVFFVQN